MGLLIPLLLLLATVEFCFAPPLPTRNDAEPTAPTEPSTNHARPSAATNDPVVHPEPKENEEVRKPAPEKVRRATLPAALTPAREQPCAFGLRHDHQPADGPEPERLTRREAHASLQG